MFETLSEKLSASLRKVRGQGRLSEENIGQTLNEVKMALLEADVNYQVANSFINRVKEAATGEDVFTSVTPGQQFVKIISDEMTSLLGSENDGISFNSANRTVVLLVGLQGAGKTTTAAKLACFLKKRWQK